MTLPLCVCGNWVFGWKVSGRFCTYCPQCGRADGAPAPAEKPELDPKTARREERRRRAALRLKVRGAVKT